MGRKSARDTARKALLEKRKDQTGLTLRIHHDPSKPREEHHYKDYYPDLDEDEHLPVYIYDGPIEDEAVTRRPQGLNVPNFKQIPKEVLPRDNSKIPKNLVKLGYKVNSLSQLTGTYVRENDQFFENEQNNDFFKDISQNQMNFRSLYDMDEQDNYYLAYINAEREKPMSRELLECSITILENEWYHLERKIPPKIRKTYSSNDELSMKASAARAFTELYGSDDGIGISAHDEQACAVCDSNDCDNSNAIIFCDGCDIAVHQDCYGVIFIPEGQWLCRRCMVSKKRKIRCQFCPSTTGAFKQTENGLWSHVLCGLWIPELYFASAGHMEPIEGTESIPKGRWKLICYICKQKMGAPIQCANKNCFLAFHPTCGRRAGLSMTMSKGVQGAVLDKSSMTAWCHKHSSAEHNASNAVLARIEKARLFFGTIASNDHQHKKTFHLVKKTNTKKWKTSRGTPIPPNYFITVLEAFLSKLKIPDSPNLAQNLTKHWSMKREMKRGAPLIRRTDATVYNGGNPEEIPQKLDFAKALLKDISSLSDISALLLEKATIEYQSQATEIDILNMVYFPYSTVLSSVMEKILKINSSRFLLDIETEGCNLSQMKTKVDNKEYCNINDFVSDLESFFVAVEKLNEPILLKAMRRLTREVINDIESIKNSHLSDIQKEHPVTGLHVNAATEYQGLSVMQEVNLSDVDAP
jgi:NuA3 HAT complex component NTO1